MTFDLTSKSAAVALAALGHEARLSVYRVLVRAGHDGLNISEIQDQLDIPASTLAHHLRALVQAGLVLQEKHGREIFNRPDFDAMDRITTFLNEECCQGVTRKTDAA